MTVDTPLRAQAGLEAETLAELKHRLLAHRSELLGREDALRARLAAEESATTNTFVAGAEGGAAAEADDEVIAMLHHDDAELAAVTAALARMQEGQYGWCTHCGEEIGRARLQALPQAELCIACQDVLEHRGAL